MRKAVLALIAAIFLLSTAGTAALAKIVLPTVDDIDTRELEPRSGTLERDRHALRLD